MFTVKYQLVHETYTNDDYYNNIDMATSLSYGENEVVETNTTYHPHRPTIIITTTTQENNKLEMSPSHNCSTCTTNIANNNNNTTTRTIPPNEPGQGLPPLQPPPLSTPSTTTNTESTIVLDTVTRSYRYPYRSPIVTYIMNLLYVLPYLCNIAPFQWSSQPIKKHHSTKQIWESQIITDTIVHGYNVSQPQEHPLVRWK
jgi:hypothetical protein